MRRPSGSAQARRRANDLAGAPGRALEMLAALKMLAPDEVERFAPVLEGRIATESAEVFRKWRQRDHSR